MAEDIRRKKWFKRDNLIILILAGILLFIIALPTKGESEKKGDVKDVNVGDTDVAEKGNVIAKDSGPAEYASEQEKKLKTLISAMEGVGKVEVMITLASSEELVVERDRTISRSNTVEKDSEGGTRTVTQYEQGDTAIYKGSSGVNEPYVIKTNNPKVEGILVVAEGAANATVNLRITESVQALYDVEAHKVKVVPLGN